MEIGTILGLGSTLRTNNNSDVPGKYSDTHFRIDGNGYDGSGRNPWPEHMQAAFNTEVKNIFTAQGWAITEPVRSYESARVSKGKNNLHLHPQDFSGVCENAERETLFEAFKSATTFVCRHVDVYDEIFDMTDEQLAEYMESKKDAIVTDLLEKFTTKRRNLYITQIGFFGVGGNVARRYKIKRLAIGDMNSYGGEDRRTEGICYTFVNAVFNELVSNGKIVTAQTRNGTGYRTAKKGDSRKNAA